MTVYLHEVPSFVALLFKCVLLYYAFRSPLRSDLTRTFVSLLGCLSALNAVEFIGIYYYDRHSLNHELMWFGFTYFSLLVPTIALILHVSLRLSIDRPDQPAWRPLFWFLYLPVLPLEYFLLFTDQLIKGFVPFKYSIIRDPGPLYFLFESYVLTYLLAALAYLIYGARQSRASPMSRTRNRLWLVGIAPLALMMLYLTVAEYLGWPKFTSTFYFPIGITVFLVVTTHAIFQYRLFDIEFYIPGSTVRARKTAFYRRIQATIAELAGLRSVDDALGRVSDILRCPVALVDRRHPVLAHAGDGATGMARFPGERLKRIDQIVVANEIAGAMPDLHRFMQEFRVAAIVPFYPHNEAAASWMLLGNSFSDSVYTPLDFKNVECLFDGLGDFFVDKLAALRAQLGDVQQQAHNAHERLQHLQHELEKLREEQQQLHFSNLQLTRENQILQQAAAQPALPPPGSGAVTASENSLGEQTAELEARLIQEVLARCNGDRSAAARLLGIRPNVLRDKIKLYALQEQNGTDA